MYNNTPRFFGKAFHPKDVWKYFKNYETVYNVIENNLDIPIYSINGKDPFDYITEFGDDYFRLKSRQATFVYKYFANNNVSFYDLPLSIEDLINFTVVYDNNETFITDFIIYSSQVLQNTNLQNILFNNDNNNDKDNINNDDDNNKIGIKKNLLNSNNNINDAPLNCDFNYNYIFKCRVDDEKKVNVYYIKEFGDIQNINPFFLKIVKINSLNPGGIDLFY